MQSLTNCHLLLKETKINKFYSVFNKLCFVFNFSQNLLGAKAEIDINVTRSS